MPRTRTARALLVLAAAHLCFGGAEAIAQPAAPPPPPVAAPPAVAPPPAAPPSPPSPDAAKEEARAHFEKGLELLQEQAWAAALAEFLVSRELYPTRNATNNAAIALRRLQRFDEALDMFETLLRTFPNMPEADRTFAQRAVVELRGLVGTVNVTESEPGAAIAVDGHNRADFPPLAPLRVSAGSHTIRVFKEGYEPFEGRLDVAGGQTAKIAAPLRRLAESGRLKVVEQTGRALEVVVNNVTVGTSPWEGAVAVGAHTVFLRGEDRTGTEPAGAPVSSHELTSLTLRAEELEGALRVDPTPAGASVALDSVTLGHGQWAGRLKAGPHRIEISAEGFLPSTRQITIERGGREVVSAELKRDPDAGVWRKPSRWTFDLGAAFALVPSLGGDLDEGHSVGAGALSLLHAGYELGSGFGFGVAGGYLVALQSSGGRVTAVHPVGNLAPQPGTASDELRLTGALAGVTGSYRFGGAFPVHLRLGAGVLLGQVRDERSGRFKASSGASYDTYPVVDTPAARYFYLDPEARVGVRFAGHFEASLSVQLLMLFAISQPKWDATKQIAASTDGIGTYPADTLTGGFVLMIAPGANLRYDF